MPSTNTDRVPITGLQVFWAVWALIGLAAVGFAAAHVGGNAQFIAAATGSWGALTIALDLLLLGVAVVVFVVVEARRLRMPMPWIWIPLAIPLPGAFLIPVFFLLRERALLRARATS
jgi:hypothetical protein